MTFRKKKTKKKRDFFFPQREKLFNEHSYFIKKTFSIGKKNADGNILTSCYNASCHLSRVLAILISG